MGCKPFPHNYQLCGRANLVNHPDTDNWVRVTMCAVLGSQAGENQDVGVRAELSVFDRNSDPGLNELTELAAVLCNADYAYLGWMDYNRLMV